MNILEACDLPNVGDMTLHDNAGATLSGPEEKHTNDGKHNAHDIKVPWPISCQQNSRNKLQERLNHSSVEVLIYVAKHGPNAMPIIEPLIQMSMANMRGLMDHISSIEPDPTTVGTADRNPETNLPMEIAAICLTPQIALKAAQAALAMICVRLRPKVSVYGGKNRPPTAWP